jgi:hypothetical protein
MSIQTMKSKIHYEEDLFFLNLQMKGLREGLQLSIDPDYFQDKILADLRFIDATLDKILSTLKGNPNLIRRAEYLYNLVKVEGAFVELLNTVLGTGEMQEALEPYRGEFLQRRESHEADGEEIRTLLRLVSQSDEEREDVITADELTLLTRPDVEEDAETR